MAKRVHRDGPEYTDEEIAAYHERMKKAEERVATAINDVDENHKKWQEASQSTRARHNSHCSEL